MANENPLFAIVPIEVCEDHRLTLEQMRVLVALLSFRGKNTDCVWPKRKQISERCGGMNISNISTATTALERLGWLEKVGSGGHSKSSEYRIKVPDLASVVARKGGKGGTPGGTTVADQATVLGAQTVARSATVADQATVADSATTTVACSATTTVAESATRNEQTIEQTIEQTREDAGASAPHTHPGGRKRRARTGEAAAAPVTFATFAERCRLAGEMLIPDGDPIIEYAESAGIDQDWLRMAWIEFRTRYTGNAKKYIDWRATFRNAVRNNWFKLWRTDNSGNLILTTEGVTAHRAMLAGDRKVNGSQQQEPRA